MRYEHVSGLVQSEFRTHALPGGGFEPPEQAAISKTERKSPFATNDFDNCASPKKKNMKAV